MSPRARAASVMVLGAVIAGAVALSLLGRETGEVVEDAREQVRAAEPTEDDAGTPTEDAAPDPRIAPDGAILRPPDGDDYACVLPDLPIEHDPRCERDDSYPACRWMLPGNDTAAGLYEVWRSTTPEHRWARPALVTLALAAAREYQGRWPGEHLTVGDLDAAGPRHQTHDRGVDVDLYLEHAMLDVNSGGGNYVDNYAERPAAEVALLRARVMDLARILATCSGGRLRIYYNDPEIIAPFLAWFSARGLVSDVGPAMMEHNRLHRFHFHVTIAEDLAPITRTTRDAETRVTSTAGTE